MKNHHPRSKRFDVTKTNDLFVVFVIITKWHEKNVVATENENRSLKGQPNNREPQNYKHRLPFGAL